MTKPKRFSVREAIAEAFGLDFAEIENDYRYQAGVAYTPCPVYAIGDDYYTATKSPSVKPKEGNGYRWKPTSASQGSLYGWQVWESIKE